MATTATTTTSLTDACKGASERKLRLLCCAAARAAWGDLPEGSRLAVEVAERYADGAATDDELDVAQDAAHEDAVAASTSGVLVALQCARPYMAVSDVVWAAGRDQATATAVAESLGPASTTVRPECLTPTVLAVATGAYDDRLPDGRLDPARLAVLSDAMEDAGCDDAALLSALRADAPRYRGFWALDAVMGEE